MSQSEIDEILFARTLQGRNQLEDRNPLPVYLFISIFVWSRVLKVEIDSLIKGLKK